MWKNIVERGRPQMAIWRIRFACWIPKATNTHLQYVIFTAFPLLQWLHERASTLRYTNTVLFHITATNVCHSCESPVNSPAFHVTNTHDAGHGPFFGNTPNSATPNRNTNNAAPPPLPDVPNLVKHYLTHF